MQCSTHQERTSVGSRSLQVLETTTAVTRLVDLHQTHGAFPHPYNQDTPHKVGPTAGRVKPAFIDAGPMVGAHAPLRRGTPSAGSPPTPFADTPGRFPHGARCQPGCTHTPTRQVPRNYIAVRLIQPWSRPARRRCPCHGAVVYGKSLTHLQLGTPPDVEARPNGRAHALQAPEAPTLPVSPKTVALRGRNQNSCPHAWAQERTARRTRTALPLQRRC